jgi:hypothetical protein
MSLRRSLLAGLIFTTLLSPAAAGGALVFEPIADTYVDARRPRQSFDRAQRLHVRGAPARASYLRFAVTGVKGRRVASARLRLELGHGRPRGTAYVLGDSAWELRTLSYARRPRLDSVVAGALAARKGERVIEVDLGGAIRGDGLYTVMLKGRGAADAAFVSSEATAGQGPTLIVEVDDGSGVGGHPLASAPSPGYEDFDFGSGVDQKNNAPTAHKPESKLWFLDGRWWATLVDPAAGGHRIHRLDPATQTWVSTGVLVDERGHSRQDVLWDGQKLYAASHFGAEGDTPAINRLLRYTYVASAKSYQLDPGFPVEISGGGTEALTLARDSTGTLWIAYTLGNQVMVNSSVGGDTQWGVPFVLPVPEGTTVDPDDIAGMIALPGRIGVFWGNQVAKKDYFAVHVDGAARTAWTEETAGEGGSFADDHLNMKLAADGRLFVAVKTSHTASGAILVGLLVRSPTGTWSPLVDVADVDVNPTRPQCVLDEEHRRVFVFYSLNSMAIYYKTSDMDTLGFPGGAGTPLIEDSTVTDINNPTTTKQSVGAGTGLVVAASDSSTNHYWHGVLSLGGATTSTTSTTSPRTTTTARVTTTTRAVTTSTVTTTTLAGVCRPAGRLCSNNGQCCSHRCRGFLGLRFCSGG